MKIIVGLGNPGKEYNGSRHNAGFMFLDRLVAHPKIASIDYVIDFRLEKKFEARVAEVKVLGEKIIIIKPQTFMNLSGKSVNKVLSYYKTKPSDLIVISDDLDLPVGFLRIRHSGSSGGHKGLQSIIDSIGSDKFARMRIGILEGDSKIPIDEVNDYVLAKVGKRAKPVLEATISEGVEYLVKHLKDKKEMPAHTIEI